jgi:hypothetical protein
MILVQLGSMTPRTDPPGWAQSSLRLWRIPVCHRHKIKWRNRDTERVADSETTLFFNDILHVFRNTALSGHHASTGKVNAGKIQVYRS